MSKRAKGEEEEKNLFHNSKNSILKIRALILVRLWVALTAVNRLIRGVLGQLSPALIRHALI